MKLGTVALVIQHIRPFRRNCAADDQTRHSACSTKENLHSHTPSEHVSMETKIDSGMIVLSLCHKMRKMHKRSAPSAPSLHFVANNTRPAPAKASPRLATSPEGSPYRSHQMTCSSARAYRRSPQKSDCAANCAVGPLVSLLLCHMRSCPSWRSVLAALTGSP
jgi:hypothetical protein